MHLGSFICLIAWGILGWELEKIPSNENVESKSIGIENANFSLQLSPLDVTSIDLSPNTCYGNYNGTDLDNIIDYQLSLPEFKLVFDRNVTTDTKSTFLVVTRNYELYELLETLQSVQDRFNGNYNYDFTFLNDKLFTKDFIKTIYHFLPNSNLNFGLIPKEHWSYPNFIDQSKAKAVREQHHNVIYGNSESYRHMCRYFSGFFYKHALLQKYDYYWRVEPGIKLLCDINYDIFKYLIDQEKLFAFTLTMPEYSETIPSLWDNYKDYKLSHQFNGDLLALIENNDKYNSYNLCHFWSNFEIASLSIFKSKQYQEFFNFFDEKGGFYYERWGDAPIHSLFIALYLNKSQLIWLNDFGYYHPPYSQCPINELTRINNKCICDPQYDFSFGFQSCTPHFINVLN